MVKIEIDSKDPNKEQVEKNKLKLKLNSFLSYFLLRIQLIA